MIVKEARQHHKLMPPDEAGQLLAVKARRRRVSVEKFKDNRGGKVPPRVCFAELPKFSEETLHCSGRDGATRLRYSLERG